MGVLMRLVLGWTNPDILDAVERCMGTLNLKPWEVRIIEALRAVTGGRDTEKIERGNLRATAVVGNQPASGPS